MKRIFKNPIFTFILGGILFGSITGVVAYSYSSNDISYTPKDTNWNVDNVGSAIDDLYNNRISENAFGTVLYSSSQGDKIGKRSTSLNVSKGKYIIAAVKGTNWCSSESSWPNLNTSEFNLGSDYENLSCNNADNCTIKQLGKYWNRIRPSSMSSCGYTHYSVMSYLYYVDVKSSSENVLSYITEDAYTYSGTSVTIIAIPVK